MRFLLTGEMKMQMVERADDRIACLECTSCLSRERHVALITDKFGIRIS